MKKTRSKPLRSPLRGSGFGFLMVLPALSLMIVLFLVPFSQGVLYSITDYRLDRPDQINFVGISNFVKILTQDRDFYTYIGFTLFYVIAIVMLGSVLGFFIALLLNKTIPARGFFRALVLLPWVISASVMATNWKWILNDNYGIVNKALQALHLIDEPILFFARKTISRITVIGIGTWKLLPFMTVVMLAAMQAIPTDQYEAASIDGVNRLQKLRFITLPGIRNVAMMCMMLQFFWNCNNFENVWLLTNGGPYYATMTVPIYSYISAFSSFNISYGSAVSVVMMVVMIVFSIIQARVERRLDA